MKKILQKSLASMVSAALCLTAFVGCLTVNAADYQGAVTSTGATVSTEDTQATVTLKLSSENAMNVAAIKVSTDYGTLASVNVGDYADKNYKIDGNYVVLDTGKLFVEAIGNETGFTTADVVLTFNKAANVVAGTYPVQVLAFAGETAATWDEKTVNLAVSGDINITVTSAHTHTWEFVSATPATATANGSISFKCSGCAETKNEAVAYNAYNTVAQFSAACESQILLQYDVWTSLFKENSDITTTIFVIEKDDYSDGALTTTTTVLTPADAVEFTANGKVAYRFYLGIAAKMLNDTCRATVYCQADGVWYNGIVNTQTYVDYATAKLSDASTGGSLKTLFVDLLNYGSSAQTTFNYNSANLANASVGDYQKFATQVDLDAADVQSQDYTLESGKIIPASYSLMAESNVQIRYAFMPYGYTPVADNVRVHFEYTDFLGNAKSVDYYSYDKLVADGNTDKIAAGEYFTIVGGRYYVDFDKLAAADCDVAITATIFDGDRPTTPDATVVYSVSSYVYTQRNAGAENLVLINNLYKYCKAALTYFTSNK